jgi:hypothetical protein
MRLAALSCLVVAGLVLVGAVKAQAATPGWRLLAVTGPTNLPPVSSEIQKVAVDAQSGTFTLTYDGQTTAPIPFNASPAQVQSGINALSSVAGSGGTVAVSGGPGDADATHPYFIRFGGALGGTNLSPVVADGSQLLPAGGSSVAVSTREDGGLPGKGEIAINATNIGGATSTNAPIVVTFALPAGITATPSSGCAVMGQSITCSSIASVQSGQTTESFMLPITVGPGAPSTAAPQVSIEGGGATGVYSTQMSIVVSSTQASAGVQAIWAGAFDSDGNPSTQAGGHPATAGAGFRLNTILSPMGDIIPAGDVKDIPVTLPPGFIGNPLVTARCPQSQLGSLDCNGATVGNANPAIQEFSGGNEVFGLLPLKNGVPPTGYAAEFTFKIALAKASVLGTVRSDDDFGVTVSGPNIANQYKVYGAFTVLQGAPADANGKAFLTNPTDCANEALIAPVTSISANTWQAASIFDKKTVVLPAVTGCNQLEFKPSFSFQPSATQAASVTAATAELTVPQDGMLDPAKLASPHLDKSVVTLPLGMVLNPSAADGLEACSTQQVGLKGTNFAMPAPIRFDKNPVTCPDASKIGTVEVKSPPIENPLAGTLYLAAQDNNPFGSLLAMYLVIEDEKTGIVAKLPGEVTPDATTGQLTAVFDHNPQLPFSSLRLSFRGGGPRSTMATPDVCTKYTTRGTFTPWSAPESGPPAQTEDSFNITTGVGGGPACPQTKAQRPFALGFSAGTTNPVAGGHSPFTLRITRPDGNQELDTVSVTTPPGFAATLKGVTTCSEAAVVAASAADRTGKAEMANPSCPASSQIGTTTIGAGVGSEPFYVKTGKVYLTGPYKGAPLSFAFIVPAVAGPFDLGVQVVRTALQVNPVNAQITAESDPIPQILMGIPLQIRDVRVDIDRPGFALNPTNCQPMAVSGQVTGGSGAVANLNNRFQVGNCSALGFKPNVKIQLHGGTKRGKYQRVVATVTARPGDANIARAAVTFPHSAFLAQEHLDKICTRVQFAAKACPARSIYGYATAITPLLDEPVQGPVYLRSNPEHELPDLVAALRGPDRLPIEVELQGRTDSKNEGIRNTFDIVPDVAVTKFTMQIKGGNHALIVNSRDLCKGKKQKASVRLNAQNGKVRNFQTVVGNDCGKKKKGSKGAKKGKAGKPGLRSSDPVRLPSLGSF